MRKLGFFLSVALLLSSCSNRRLYYWGSYEQSLYRMYGKPDQFNMDNEIALLSEEIERAVESNQPVPPGKRPILDICTIKKVICPRREPLLSLKRSFILKVKFLWIAY